MSIDPRHFKRSASLVSHHNEKTTCEHAIVTQTSCQLNAYSLQNELTISNAYTASISAIVTSEKLITIKLRQCIKPKVQ